MKTTATFSPCRTWRYTLTRVWDEKKHCCVFIGLNPSTADETQDDPTIRRCIGFARDWNFGALVMLNIFALRSTDPAALYSHSCPEGPENETHIMREIVNASRVVCAWGNHGKLRERGKYIRETVFFDDFYPNVFHFGLTKSGQPKHPLYLPRTAHLEPFNA